MVHCGPPEVDTLGERLAPILPTANQNVKPLLLLSASTELDEILKTLVSGYVVVSESSNKSILFTKPWVTACLVGSLTAENWQTSVFDGADYLWIYIAFIPTKFNRSVNTDRPLSIYQFNHLLSDRAENQQTVIFKDVNHEYGEIKIVEIIS